MELPGYIGRYVVRHEIARGGFAVVALSWDEELAADVAIKILLENEAGDDALTARFIEEARLLRRIQSYNVVGVHDIGRLSSGQPYFVMDYADQGPLTAQLGGRTEADGGMPQHDVLQLVDAVTSGLSAIHRAGVVHRDIKPDNILYQTVGLRSSNAAAVPPSDDRTVQAPAPPSAPAGFARVMIGDLGIASDLQRESAGCQLVGGTPAYMAPEQFDVDQTPTSLADIYAATAVLWYAVTGTRPPAAADLGAGAEKNHPLWQDFFVRGMAARPSERFADIQSWSSAAHDIMARIAAQEPVAVGPRDGSVSVSGPDGDCPYHGLSAFQPEDADRFFGREELVADLLQRLRTSHILVVGGASGSGKSSLIRAGVIPSLKQGLIPGSDTWRVELFTPGRDALAELFFRLRGADGDARVRLDEFIARPSTARQVLQDAQDRPLLLVIDQFEELFTLNDEKITQGFVDALAAICDPADSDVRIIITIRADFYEKCAAIQWLAEAVSRNQVLVGPMSANDLRRAIVEPARRAGAYVEQNLVDAIIAEAGKEAGVLPLISHALVETWKRRLGATLTYEGYRSSGGMTGAIQQTADAIFDNTFSDEERKVAERLLLSLVTPGEGGADTRRILARADLHDDPDARVMGRVIIRLTEARLLTVDDETIQITHEALLRSWPRLSRWIDRSWGDLRLRLRIVQMAEEWIEADRGAEMLVSGARLDYILEWLEKHRDSVGAKEIEFLTRSEMARNAARSETDARRQKRRRRQMLAVCALVALTIGTTAASVIAFRESRQARQNAALADTATLMAKDRLSSALGAAAAGYAMEDPLLALNLAAQSISQSRDPGTRYDAQVALLKARSILATGLPVPMGTPVAVGDALALAISPDGRHVIVGGRDGTIRILDATNRQQIGERLVSDLGGIQDIAFAPDGKRLAAVGDKGHVAIWPFNDGLTGNQTPIGQAGDIQWRLAFHPSGAALATAGEDGRVNVWSTTAQGQSQSRVIGSRHGDFTSVAFSPDGKTIAAGTGSGEVHAWTYPAGDPVFPPLETVHTSDVWMLSFSADGTRIATASSDGTSAIVQTPSGDVLNRAFSGNDMISSVQFMPAGSKLVGGSSRGRLLIWDVAAGARVAMSPTGHSGRILDLSVSDDRTTAATLGADQNVRFWRLGPPPPRAIAFSTGDSAKAKGLAVGHDALFFGDTSGAVNRADLTTQTTKTGHAHGHEVWAIALSPEGTTLATADRMGHIILSGAALKGPLTKLRPLEEAIWDLQYTSDASRLMAAADSAVHLISLDDTTAARQFAPQHGRVTRAVLDSGSSRIAVATSRGDVIVWPIDRIADPMVLKVSGNLIWSVAFSRDGTLLAVGDSDETVSIWRLSDATRLQDFSGHTRGATDVVFLGDGKSLLAADRSGGLHIWDLNFGKLIGRIPDAHGGAIWRLGVFPDGQTFASAGDDGMVKLWDVLSADTACTLSTGILSAQQRAQYLGAAHNDDACALLGQD
ncbi:protein kinase domain-containing protein [Sulfitobacter sp. S190]|uniref:nSTAND1 domain-containing NTPase n=1 Tax=Sulfitobacter sp. S190 TaxID=2867022 RepID=UPI0021A5D59D|nr:protein kinase [Sulfitobacter sp. S190]UWR21191.1 protein kinase [Sulfitobacter sp. S190]